jgi:hypothetical protein
MRNVFIWISFGLIGPDNRKDADDPPHPLSCRNFDSELPYLATPAER